MVSFLERRLAITVVRERSCRAATRCYFSKQSVGADSNWREQAKTVKIRQTGYRSVSDRWSSEGCPQERVQTTTPNPDRRKVNTSVRRLHLGREIESVAR